MSDLPKIDVVMPIGHWSPHLSSTLTSLKVQEPVFDLIVQDASDDQRVETVFKNSGLQIKEYCKEADNGQADAIAKGWAKSGNDIVFWLNADDMLLSTTFERVRKIFADDRSLDVVYGQSTISDANGAILGLHPEVRPIGPLLKRSNIISQPSCFVRRKAVNSIGGLNPKLEYTMDWDLWLRLYLANKKFRFVDDVLSNVTWELGTKTSGVNSKRLKEVYKLLRRSSSAFTALKGIIGVFQHHQRTYFGKQVALLSKAEIIKNFPVINLSDSPQNRLQVDIENLSKHTRCICSNARIETGNNGFLLNFSRPVPPAHHVEITIECETGAPDLFKSVSWDKALC